MVCYAIADGSISKAERTMILMDAKELLPYAEYQKFRKSLDRIVAAETVVAEAVG